MRNLTKKILYALPLSARKLVVIIREWFWKSRMLSWEKQQYKNLPQTKNKRGKIKNVLVYHISGMSFAGTERCLQLIANSLANDYNVFFMFGDKTIDEGRKKTMHPNITPIPFSYSLNDIAVPHRINGMNPHIKNVLSEYQIDLIVTASPGYSHYPWNIITEIPIVLVNIFGAPTLQKNIIKYISISNTVKKHAQKWTGGMFDRDITLYAPIAKMPTGEIADAESIRNKFNIKSSDFVFGRIGRNDDGIFDPIGIKAWKKIAKNYPNVHYLIMSAPPALIKIVNDEMIPRVHFLPPSGDENDVWRFHKTINAMAHFRKDGETSGVAIAESLVVGNPILTHRSYIWNAHLEYLNNTFALVADFDNVEEYSSNMERFIEIWSKNPEQWSKMRELAQKVGVDNFSPIKYSDKIRGIISNI